MKQFSLRRKSNILIPNIIKIKKTKFKDNLLPIISQERPKYFKNLFIKRVNSHLSLEKSKLNYYMDKIFPNKNEYHREFSFFEPSPNLGFINSENKENNSHNNNGKKNKNKGNFSGMINLKKKNYSLPQLKIKNNKDSIFNKISKDNFKNRNINNNSIELKRFPNSVSHSQKIEFNNISLNNDFQQKEINQPIIHKKYVSFFHFQSNLNNAFFKTNINSISPNEIITPKINLKQNLKIKKNNLSKRSSIIILSPH